MCPLPGRPGAAKLRLALMPLLITRYRSLFFQRGRRGRGAGVGRALGVGASLGVAVAVGVGVSVGVGVGVGTAKA